MHKTVFIRLLSVLALLAGVAGTASAQTAAALTGAVNEEIPATLDIAPPPVLPATESREGSKVTVRAVRIQQPLRVDGALDEEVYTRISPMGGFIQAEPAEGEAATEKTDIWVLFDRDTLYLVAKCWETRPDRLMANELRRDHNNIIQNDNIAFILDTFYDRRSGVVFETTPIAARLDVQFATEGQSNYDWNPVWDVKVKRTEQGWTVEAAVPFKSLRYRQGQHQVWGINVRRSSRWKNEISFLAPVPASVGMGGVFRASFAATMVGLEAPAGARNLEIKPYAFSSLTTDRSVTPGVANDLGGDAGVDVKYGVTQNLTADFTYNTDFAQVEADSQQINLTRFSLFFPEKREFFVENQGLFSFGGGGGMGGGTTPILFYSRRIGLNGGREVPIIGGGRLTGRVGRLSIGAVNIQSGEDEISRSAGTNFSVLRLRRDVLRKSAIGMIFTGRSTSATSTGANFAYGLDGRFAFHDNLMINTYWAKTRTNGIAGDDTSYRAQFNYEGDLIGIQGERLSVGDHFNPEVGFVRRDDMRRSFGEFRFSPRLNDHPFIRKWSAGASTSYIENGGGQMETREQQLEFGIDFHNSDSVRASYNDTFELLPSVFAIAPGIRLPVGGYDFAHIRGSYEFGRQRQVSGTVSFESGTFYSGRRRTLGVSGGRANLTPHFSVEPSYSVNWVDLVEGSFTTTLMGSRITNTMTPMMFASAFLQYNSSNNTLAANVRLRWEYRPGSELFVVYNDQRDTLTRGIPDLRNRAFIVKVNRLLRF